MHSLRYFGESESPIEVLERTAGAIAHLRQLFGKPATSPSRIENIVRVMQSHIDGGQVVQAEVRQAHIDALQLRLIALRIDAIDTPRLHEDLKRLFSGSLLPDPGQGSPGKAQDGYNIQFELFVAASLAESGFSVRLREPDIHARFGNWTFRIAAKRPVSLKEVRRRLQDGAKQLRDTSAHETPRQPCVIALDTTWLGNKHGRTPIFDAPSEDIELAAPGVINAMALRAIQSQPETRKLIAQLHEFGVDATLAMASCAVFGLDGRIASSHQYQVWNVPGGNSIAADFLSGRKGPRNIAFDSDQRV